ncbi:hypothetical protein D3C81_1270760 [compost metagenome]
MERAHPQRTAGRHRLGRHLPDQCQQPAEQRRRRVGLHHPHIGRRKPAKPPAVATEPGSDVRHRPPDRRHPDRQHQRPGLPGRHPRGNLRRFRPGAGYRAGRGRSRTAPHPAVRAGWRRRPQSGRMPVAATAPTARYNPVDDRSQAPGHRFHRPARQPRLQPADAAHENQGRRAAPGHRAGTKPQPAPRLADRVQRARVRGARRHRAQGQRPLAGGAEPGGHSAPARQPAVRRLCAPGRHQRRQHLHAQPVAGSALVHQEPAKPQRNPDEGGHADRRAPARLPRPR